MCTAFALSKGHLWIESSIELEEGSFPKSVQGRGLYPITGALLSIWGELKPQHTHRLVIAACPFRG